ncbi:MAG: marine proteobacterial sortase target protein [Nitrospinota bacterium]|nr:marine proteobacterial sortase target protein [Nitrospinota bacterium]
MKKGFRIAWITALAVFAALIAPAAASPAKSFESFIGEMDRGGLVIKEGEGYSLAPLLETKVSVSVTGPMIRVKITQEFTNPGQAWVEGVYVFPLPPKAGVDGMRLMFSGRIIEGVIQEKEQAKKTYEAAKSEGKKTALVSQNRPNIFTMSLANIEPGGKIQAQIEFGMMAELNEGVSLLRLPLVVGPRYIPGQPVAGQGKGLGWAFNTDQVPDASSITPPVAHPNEGKINPVSIEVDLAPGYSIGDIRSQSHRIQVESSGTERYRVALADQAWADGDFILQWRPGSGMAPSVAAFTEKTGKGAYTLLQITPPAAESGPAPARELIYVLDVSGSMAGESIKQAKAALLMALDRLKEGDAFNIIAFDDRRYPLFPALAAVTHDSMEQAKAFVKARQAGGGTEIYPALQMALAQRGGEKEKLRQIVFLTDGSVGNEDEVMALIQRALGEARLFTVGIGSAPNGYFMEKAAQMGRGAFIYVASVDEVEEKMARLFAKLERPAITDLKLEVEGGGDAEYFPYPIPDVYSGEPVVVAARTSQAPAGFIIQGRRGGTEWKLTSKAAADERPGVGKMWARWKIERLIDAFNKAQNGPDADGIRRAVVDLSMEHHLISRFTSMVAVDVTPVRPEDQALATHAMKTNMPRGWEYAKVFGMAKTATWAAIYFYAGLALLLAAMALWMAAERRMGR